MNTALVDGATIVATLNGVDGLRATLDPAEAAANRPCVLVGPPVTDYTRRERTWSVRCLPDDVGGGATTWEQLDNLESLAAAVLPLESSRPESYRLSDDLPQVPCHVLTLTT